MVAEFHMSDPIITFNLPLLNQNLNPSSLDLSFSQFCPKAKYIYSDRKGENSSVRPTLDQDLTKVNISPQPTHTQPNQTHCCLNMQNVWKYSLSGEVNSGRLLKSDLSPNPKRWTDLSRTNQKWINKLFYQYICMKHIFMLRNHPRKNFFRDTTSLSKT